MTEKSVRYETFKEFWPFYLTEHSDFTNRTLHFIGTNLGICLAVYAVYSQTYWLLPFVLVCGYAFAWVGHFFFEKNVPATFTYPFKSFAGDWVMWYYIWTFQIGKQLELARQAMDRKPIAQAS